MAKVFFFFQIRLIFRSDDGEFKKKRKPMRFFVWKIHRGNLQRVNFGVKKRSFVFSFFLKEKCKQATESNFRFFSPAILLCRVFYMFHKNCLFMFFVFGVNKYCRKCLAKPLRVCGMVSASLLTILLTNTTTSTQLWIKIKTYWFERIETG